MPAATSFTNPATGTRYRLAVHGESWRITKSMTLDDGSIRLTNLRGSSGSDLAPMAAIDLLIQSEAPQAVSGDPQRTFSVVVLEDLTRTKRWLIAHTGEAEHAYQTGARGFRPRCAALRKMRDDTVQKVMTDCLEMVAAWKDSGLTAEGPLPDWLAAGLDDAEETATAPSASL